MDYKQNHSVNVKKKLTEKEGIEAVSFSEAGGRKKKKTGKRVERER